MRKFMGLGCVVVLFLVSGCGSMMESKGVAETQVTTFHEQFNDSDFEAIISSTHSLFLKETPEEEFTELLTAVRKKLGKVTKTSSEQFNIDINNGVTTVVLVKNTTFEEGTGTETFTFRVANKKASIVGYFINSKDLILK